MQDTLLSPVRGLIYAVMALVSHVLCGFWPVARLVFGRYLQSNLQRAVFVAVTRVPVPVVAVVFACVVVGIPRIFPQVPKDVVYLLMLLIPYIHSPHVLTRPRALFHLDGMRGRKLGVHMRAVKRNKDGSQHPYAQDLLDVVQIAIRCKATALTFDSPLLVNEGTRYVLERRLVKMFRDAGHTASWHAEEPRAFSAFKSGMFAPYRRMYGMLKEDRVNWKSKTSVMSCKATLTIL